MCTYRITEVVGENPEVDTHVEQKEPNNDSDNSCSDLNSHNKLSLGLNLLTINSKR